MGKNTVLECIKPVINGGISTKDEILVLLEKVLEIMENGFVSMDTRLQIMEEQLNRVKGLIEKMNINR